jgi:DNA-directed RNA polymerase subunit beta'
MIKFLNLEQFVKGLTPVTSTEFYTRTGEFQQDGLLSEKIFGIEGSSDRRNKYSFINLNAFVIHPSAYKVLIQLDRRIIKFISTESQFSLDKEGQLIEVDNGITGINEFIKIFPKINFRGGSSDRDKFIGVLQKAYEDKTLFLDKVPVIPPDLRPITKDVDGTIMADPLNDYYVTIIRRSFQVKSAGHKGPLFDLLNYGLQKAVIAHDDFIRTKIGKKFGVIRDQLLSKRVDFSGRAVITPGPNLKVNEIGLPLKIAVNIFKPFVLHQLLYAGRVDQKKLEREVKAFTKSDLSVDSVERVIKSIKNGDKIPPALYDMFFEATEVAMMGRVVLAKRDPDLHRESLRAVKPILINGETIQICGAQCSGWNADFDGDQMAIYLPISEEAQAEAIQKMMTAVSGDSSKSLAFELSKEICTGLYVITKDIKINKPAIHVTEKDLEEAKNPYNPVVYNGRNTTMGKAIFNNCLPKDHIFINELVDKKMVNNLISDIVDKYGDEEAIKTTSKLGKVGFKFATILSPTFTLENLILPKEIYDLKKKLTGTDTEKDNELLQQMRKILVEYLKKEGSGFYDLLDSGATKGVDQPFQILVSKGIVADATGKILPTIKGSYTEGLKPTEYFLASSGARKGIISRVLSTADTGYLSRKLVYLLNSVEADPYLTDCKTSRTLDIKLESDLMKKITGRYVVVNGEVEEFDPKKFKVGQLIHLRSPIYCESPKICHICYGKLLMRHKTPYIGVIAGQILGERSTQGIMKEFHVGGSIKLSVRNMLNDIVMNDPLMEE